MRKNRYKIKTVTPYSNPPYEGKTVEKIKVTPKKSVFKTKDIDFKSPVSKRRVATEKVTYYHDGSEKTTMKLRIAGKKVKPNLKEKLPALKKGGSIKKC